MAEFLSVQARGNVSKVVVSPLDLERVVRAQSAVVLREYKQQVPVDKGLLRKSVTSTNIPGGFEVSAKMPYATYVHDGTGTQRGGPDQGRRGVGRVRSGTVEKGIGGIRPNKFATRTFNQTKGDLFRALRLGLLNKTREQVRFTVGGREVGGAISTIR